MKKETKTEISIPKVFAIVFGTVVVFMVTVITCIRYDLFTIDRFWDSMFKSMFDETSGIVPSLFEISIPVVTAVIALWGIRLLNRRTKAAEGQNETAQKNHAIEIKDNHRNEFQSYLEMMNYNNAADSWYAGMRLMKQLALDAPKDYTETVIETLIMVGRVFSAELDMIGPQKNKYGSVFVVFLLRTISEIVSSEECNEHVNFTVHIQEFYAAQKFTFRGREQSNPIEIKDISFENFQFTACDFRGIIFKRCNFYDAIFSRDTKIRLDDCLISSDNFCLIEDKDIIRQQLYGCILWPTNTIDWTAKDVESTFGVRDAGDIKILPFNKFDEWQKQAPPRPFGKYTRLANRPREARGEQQN
ncbi:MAG: hypothetical protein HRU29_01590 [Rhizobiales bacterium]|nr:hypothetical protein [Hyphomicrobiales bacterium]NRB13067.1 hypothetical protein [Hyphomicrobiales bacterium]